MRRHPLGRGALAALALALALPVLGTSTAHAAPAPEGGMGIDFGPSFVASMFKAGVFVYNASSVTVGMSDSGSLGVGIPLEYGWKGKATTYAAMDPETGAIEMYNGPAGARLGIGSVVIRRTGSTGTVRAELIGPFSKDTGEQWTRTLTLFTLSKASGRQQSCGWSMSGRATLTPEAAALLNERLATTVFTATAPIGRVSAGVGSCEP